MVSVRVGVQGEVLGLNNRYTQMPSLSLTVTLADRSTISILNSAIK